MAKKKTGTDVEVLDSDEYSDGHTLSKAEKDLRADCEAVIAAGLEEFFRVALALKAIHDGRLYRDRYRTFEEYARERWELHRATLYRRIRAAEVAESLSPTGDTLRNEAQARELARLTPEQRVVVAERIREHGKSLSEASAKWIREVAEEVAPRERNPDTELTVDTRRARTFLEKLNVYVRSVPGTHGERTEDSQQRARRLSSTRSELLAWVTDPDHPERVHRIVYLWAILPDKRAVKAALEEQGRDAKKELGVKP